MKCVLAVAIAVCALSSACAGDDENPFKNAKVGDYAEYKMTMMRVGGFALTGNVKMTVIAKDDKQATVKTTVKFGTAGKDMKEVPSQKHQIDLTKPYDPVRAFANLPPGAEVKTEKGSGTEKIKAAGKEYDCTWINATIPDSKKAETPMQIWFSKEVPLYRIVKSEAKTPTMTRTLELTGFGNMK